MVHVYITHPETTPIVHQIYSNYPINTPKYRSIGKDNLEDVLTQPLNIIRASVHIPSKYPIPKLKAPSKYPLNNPKTPPKCNPNTVQISPGTYLIKTITTKFPLVPLIIHNLKTNYADDGIMWFDLDSQMFLSLSMSHLLFCPLSTCSSFLSSFLPFFVTNHHVCLF